jgi:hypothetical protein
MKAAIKHRIELARSRSAMPYSAGRPASAPAPTAVLMSSPLVLEAMKEVNAVNTLTIEDVMLRLHCGKDKALRTFKREPGVVKIGKSYLIPQSVFDRVVRRGLILN